MRPVSNVVLAVAASAVLFTPLLWADEAQLVMKSDMPEAVLRAFQESFPGVKVTGYDKEDVDDLTHYEIETNVDKRQKDYVYLEDGTLLQIEEEIPVKELPKLVLEAVRKAHPDAEIDEAEKIMRGTTLTHYEIVIEVDEHEIELLVSPDGQITTSDQMNDIKDNAKDEDTDVDDDEEDID